MPLAAINDAHPEGKTLLASARQILANIGKRDAAAISIDDVADPAKIFADTRFNGDGVVTRRPPSDEATRAVIRPRSATASAGRRSLGQAGRQSGARRRLLRRGAARSATGSPRRGRRGDVFPLGPSDDRGGLRALPPSRPRSTTTSRAAGWPRSTRARARRGQPQRRGIRPTGRQGSRAISRRR